MSLEAAAAALDALAAGIEPKRGDVISGALSLQTLVREGRADRDMTDAAKGLEGVATGRPLDLNAAGRARAGELASHVRNFASTN